MLENSGQWLCLEMKSGKKKKRKKKEAFVTGTMSACNIEDMGA